MSKAYCCSCQAIIFSWHNQIKHRNVLIRKEQQTSLPNTQRTPDLIDFHRPKAAHSVHQTILFTGLLVWVLDCFRTHMI